MKNQIYPFTLAVVLKSQTIYIAKLVAVHSFY